MGFVQILMSIGQSDGCSLDPSGLRETPEKDSMVSGRNSQVPHLWGSFKLPDATHMQLSGGMPKIMSLGLLHGSLIVKTPSNTLQLVYSTF